MLLWTNSVNFGFLPLIIFAKCSIIAVRQDPKYDSNWLQCLHWYALKDYGSVTLFRQAVIQLIFYIRIVRIVLISLIIGFPTLFKRKTFCRTLLVWENYRNLSQNQFAEPSFLSSCYHATGFPYNSFKRPPFYTTLSIKVVTK